MSKKILSLAFVVILSALLLAACQPKEVEVVKEVEVIVTQEVEVEKEVIVTVEVEKEAPEETQVIFALYQEPQILNPFIATQTASGEATAPIIEGLIGVNAKGEYYPVLAKEVPTEENGGVVIEGDGERLIVTYNLLEDVKWSTGDPFTCDDVLFTWEAVMHPESGAVSTSNYANITSVECPDEYTAVVTFEPFYGPYLQAFGAILPRHATGDPADMQKWPYNWHPIGTGPFKMTEWVPGDHITMVKNENYRDYPEKPYIDKFIIRITPSREAGMAMIQTGEIDFLWDLIEAVVPDLEGKPGVAVHVTPGIGTERLVLNLTERPGGPNNVDWTIEDEALLPDPRDVPHPLLGDVRVRQAIQYAINKQELIDILLYGAATVGTMELNIGQFGAGCDIPPSEYNPEMAKQLLEEAGFTDEDGDGIRECNGCLYAEEGAPLRLKLQTTTGNKLREQAEQLLLEYWAEVGIEGYIENVPSSVLFGSWASGAFRKIGDFDILMYTTSPAVDPQNFMMNYHGTGHWPTGANGGSGWNYARWVNPLQEELERAGRITDVQERARIYCDVQKAIAEELPHIYLYNRSEIHATREGLMGYEISTWGNQPWNVAEWYWEGQK